MWLSRDERTGLDVALKIVPREGKRPARAHREMEAATRLRHRRCVRAYDYGEDAGHVYIAYELVQGSTLRELIRRERLSDEEAVEAAAQVLEGLAHAHGRGIVHRDVKPSNVLLEDGPEVSVRLLDFGLAQFEDADTLTAVGDVPGTLAYIAPERLGGSDASTRSDVWAVGVMLWEMLAGTHPFWGIPLPAVASAIEAGAPPIATRRPELPRGLLAAIDSALAIDPARRPAAGRLSHELREAVTVRPRPERAGRRSPIAPRELERQGSRPAPEPASVGARVLSAGAGALATAGGASLLPFWPTELVVAIALTAGLVTLRAPRLGLAIALAAPILPLGNLAQSAAVVYGGIALLLLAAGWRDPRAGLSFVTGPLLAAVGLLALLPLAVQGVAGVWRRALHAFAGVLTAAAVAGLAGDALPLTGSRPANLGIEGSERPSVVAQALGTELRAESALLTTALALAIVACLLPRAMIRGQWGIAGLGALQLALVLVWAPALPWPGLVLGTVLLCGLLAGRPVLATVRQARAG